MEDFYKNQTLNRAIFHGRDIKHIRLFGGLFLLKNEEPFLYYESDNIFFEVRNVSDMTITEGTAVRYENNQNLVNSIANFIKLKDFKRSVNKCREYLTDASLSEFESFFKINQGAAYLNLEEFDKAILNFEESLLLDDNIPKIYSNLARAWYGKYTKILKIGEQFKLRELYAIECLLNAKKYYDLLISLENEPSRDECIEEVSQIRVPIDDGLEYYSTDFIRGLSSNRLPYIIHEIKQISLEFTSEIINKNPELFESLISSSFYDIDTLAWFALAKTYMALNQNEIALGIVEKGMEFVEEKISGFELMKIKGELLLKLGNIEDASRIFSSLLERDENDFRVKEFYADICWGAAKVAKTLDDIPRFEELKSRTISLIETHCYDKEKRIIINEELSNT